MDGKNVYDFIDPDIEAKLNALEEEEERLEGEGFYDSDDEIVSLLLRIILCGHLGCHALLMLTIDGRRRGRNPRESRKYPHQARPSQK